LLGEFGANAALLEAREVLHEDPAIQVVDFMLQTNSKQPLGFDREGFASLVERANGNGAWPLDIFEDARN
jgi:hypothetical protein